MTPEDCLSSGPIYTLEPGYYIHPLQALPFSLRILNAIYILLSPPDPLSI